MQVCSLDAELVAVVQRSVALAATHCQKHAKFELAGTAKQHRRVCRSLEKDVSYGVGYVNSISQSGPADAMQCL